MKVITGRNGAASTCVSTGSGSMTYRVPASWGKNGSFPAGDDYCIITVEKPGKHGTFSLNSSLSSSKTYTLCGYEIIAGDNRYQTKDSGSVSVKSGSNSKRLTYKIYGAPGQSGSPIYNGTSVVGIHAYEIQNSSGEYTSNSGTKITPTVISFAK